AAKKGITPSYVQRLLSVFYKDEGGAPGKQIVSKRPIQPLSEPLSERERGVLRLLETDLSGPDIARELRVSVNTLRTH
ncbi:LuxR C-terminal-related transcriptional regulator, partial [Lysinibacillus sp. GbtcB16]|uniref:LuxR C-terminal-related transcriptional regulator n=1 Tax=Lysinibacillus sp. GbtcB16 TaxID=2824761 RepID=UPI001C2F4A51